MNDPFVAETLAREDFDAVTLDMQHGGVDFAGATRAILAIANAGKPTIVRVPLDDFATASRARRRGRRSGDRADDQQRRRRSSASPNT